MASFSTVFAEQPSYEKISELLDDFMIESTINDEILQKYSLVSSDPINETVTKLVLRTEENSTNPNLAEITLIISQNKKILNTTIRFFTDAKIGHELNVYCDICFSAVTERYGLPNLEGLSGFVNHPIHNNLGPKEPIKRYWLNNNSNYRYFYGAYQRPSYVEGYGFIGGLDSGARGILFIVQSSDYYDDNTIVPVARYGELPYPKAYAN